MRAGDIPVAARRLIFSLGLRLGDRIMLQRFRNYQILLLYLSGTLTRLADSGTGAEASVKLIVWGISPNGVCLERLADGGSAASFTKCRARMPSWLLPELWLLSTYSSANFMRTSRAASCLLLRRSGEPFRFTFFHCAGITK